MTIDGHAQSVDDVHHFVSVDASVDAVLMLDDRDVTLVQQCRRMPPPMTMSH